MFDVSGERYDRFMGRYSRSLAPQVAALAGLAKGMRVLDVGCGPGALASEVAVIVGEQNVAAIDPEQQFVDACSSRLPRADVRQGFAEQLPWPDESFDAAVSQLVVAFMSNATKGVAEMRRVVKPGGTVTIATWDIPRLQLNQHFWEAARTVGADVPETRQISQLSSAELRELADAAGLSDICETELRVESTYAVVRRLLRALHLRGGPDRHHLPADGRRDEDRAARAHPRGHRRPSG